MSRRMTPTTFAGIDVGGKELVVTYLRRGAKPETVKLPNTTEGHKTLERILTKKAGPSRVVLEATGVFHLDLALHLSKSPRIELMVANPLAARNFARAQMKRAKTDRVDAGVLLEFAMRMSFERWRAPSDAMLQFRALARHLASLVDEQAATKNRIAAARSTHTTPAYVLADLESQLVALQERIDECQAEAVRLARAHEDLSAAFETLLSAPGVGERSAVRLLGELGVLDQTMTPDEVVGHAGLDPRPFQSGMRGNSDQARKISKVGNSRIRAAMYMVALTAARGPGTVHEVYRRLRERGKVAFVAHVAIMRRMLRVLWVLLVRKTAWVDESFGPRPPSIAPASFVSAGAAP